MTNDLQGKHALICGASQGIGRATALALSRKGAKVTLLARTESALTELATNITKEGNEVVALLPVNLEDEQNVKDEVDRLIITKGAVHILINNSSGPPPGPLLKSKSEDFLSPIKRHLFASHALVQSVLPGMQSEQFGRIVNIISTSVKEPIPNLGVSNIVRAAMASWAKTLAMELPPGITINNVLPGFTETKRLELLRKNSAQSRNVSEEQINKEWIQTIPEGRLGQADEIANCIAFLASPEASYIRGQSIAVDGGRTKSL